MSSRFVLRLVCAITLLACAPGLAAEDDWPPERRFYVAPSLVHNSIDDDTGFDAGTGYQLAIGKAFRDWLNVELLLTETDHDGKDGAPDGDVSLYGLGALIFPMRDRVPFFLSAAVWSGELDRDSGPSHRDADAWDIGIGYLHEINAGGLAIRAEYRRRDSEYRDIGGSLSEDILALGLQVPFGDRPKPPQSESSPPPPPRAAPAAPPPPPKCPDSDGDKVCEDKDRCPNTPPEQIAAVLENGCGLDDCRLPSPGETVDEHGCAIEITVVLRDVHFDTAKATLRPESKATLDRIISVLKATPSVKKVEIGGHTDSRGADDYNRQLSQQRAESVIDYLKAGGIDNSRLKAQGYGETRPIASNDTADGRAQNRRVELKVLERGE